MKTLFAALPVLLIALAGCAPIPIPSQVFVPNPTDAKAQSGHRGGGCTVGELRTVATRNIGTAKVEVKVWADNPDTPNAQASAQLAITQVPKNGPVRPVTLNPARITLEEGGRVLAASTRKTHDSTNPRTGTQHNSVFLKYPTPSGNSDSLRLVFQRGAIVLGGQTVEFAPIRFNRTTEVAIYLFPCLPA